MYRNSNNWQSELRQRFLARGTPATYTIVGLGALSWFLIALTHSELLVRLLGFDSAQWPIPYPWTAVTWSILMLEHPIWVLFSLLWMYNAGSSLERSWGTQRFTYFYLATSALTAVTYAIGGFLLHRQVGLTGYWIGDAATTVAWCLLNRRQCVCLGMVLPIPAIYFAYITLLVVWYMAGMPFIGLFALSGCAGAWWYVERERSRGFAGPRPQTFRLPSLTKPRQPESGQRDFSLAALRREREERKRLEDMFRRSGFDDKDNR